MLSAGDIISFSELYTGILPLWLQRPQSRSLQLQRLIECPKQKNPPRPRELIAFEGAVAFCSHGTRCFTCRRKKVRCSGTSPCTYCSKRGLECALPELGQRRAYSILYEIVLSRSLKIACSPSTSKASSKASRQIGTI